MSSVNCKLHTNVFVLQKFGDTSPVIKDCPIDVPDSYEILPNSVQLVSSKMPLHEAVNLDELSGVFLFRQIFSPEGKTFQCLFCRNKDILSSPDDLENHYKVIHEFAVNTSTAEFNQDVVVVSVISCISEETIVNFVCCCCGTTLKTVSEMRDHYLNAHNKAVSVLLESDVADVGKFFYCGSCGHPSIDFNSHHQHMKDTHRMQTYVCRDCTYCTSRPSWLRTHTEGNHLEDQLLQCSVCSVYFHGKEELTKHMLSHTVQTENMGHNLTETTENSASRKLKVKKCGYASPVIADCRTDVPEMYEILPNSVQLVSSKMPLHEAVNLDKLSGVFLFRQIFSPEGKTFQCLFCRNMHILSSPDDLENHYQVNHEFAVNTSTAEFNQDTVFFRAISCINEEAIVNFVCCCCGTTLKTVSEMRDHYLNAHNKAISVLLESDVADVGKFFYCGLCGHPSVDFNSHHQHMKDTHRMQTYVCRDCTYCTSRPSWLRTHMEGNHLEDQLFHCSVCSVYLHGEELTKHLLSHAVQAGSTSRNLINQLQKIIL